jgi:type II secretion system protein N
VKSLSKAILIALIVVVFLAAAGIISAALYIRSDGARGQLESKLTEALKAPVKVGRISASGLSLRAEGIALASPDGDATPLLSAESLHANFRFAPLLTGDLRLHDVVLEKAHLAWPQDAEGKWVWPSEKKSGESKSEEPKPEKPAHKVAAPEKQAVAFDGVSLRDSTIELLDAKRQPVLVATGVTADLTEVGKNATVGALHAGTIKWDKYTFTSLQTPFRYTPGSLELSNLVSGVFGGEARGTLELDTKTEGSPFKVHLEITNADLAVYAKTAGLEEGEVGGKLSGKADVTGKGNKILRFEGPANISIAGGHFRKLELFDSVAHLLDLPELANMQPREATAQVNFRDEKAFVESLVIATENVRITAKGVARFDTKLIMDAHLTVSESLAKSMQQNNLGNFTRQPDGQYGVDFKISGNTNKPKTDLAEKVMGGKVKDKVGDLLGDLFGSKKEPKDKDKDKEKEKDKKKDKEKSDKKDGEKKDEKEAPVQQ